MSTRASGKEFGSFDFGLSPEEEARAARLHAESIIIDMLYWGPVGFRSYTKEMEQKLDALWNARHDPFECSIAAITLPINMAVRGALPEFKTCWDASGVTAGTRTVDGFASFEAFALTFGTAIAQFDHLPWQIKALRADDFRRAKAEGKHAGFINTQLSAGIGMNLINLLEPAYDLGLRMLQLTYNYMTFIGSGATERTDAGVSSYGARVIARINELGIIVDTSHCGRQTTLDACALSKAPVIASHASATGAYEHARGKTDEELRALAETGGIIGVVTVPFYLAAGQNVTIESMLDHIDYIANLVGWEHVGIGTDWPMPMPKSTLENAFAMFAVEFGFRPEDNIDTLANLIGFDDYRDFPNITRGLVKRGYSDEQIKGILGENFLRVFEQVCG